MTLRFEGSISGAAFASGDRFVAGTWDDSPFGSFADLMWARPDDTRVLLAPTDETAAFIGSHYAFEEVRVGPVEVDGRTVAAQDVRLDVQPGPRGALGLLVAANPLRRLHRVNDLLAGRVLPGVRTSGVTK